MKVQGRVFAGFKWLIGLAGLLLLVACDTPFDQPKEDQPPAVTLGMLIDSTAYAGQANKQAVQLAAREINQQGGVLVGNTHRPLKLIILDSFGRPDKARENARQLIYQHQVTAIIGPSLSRTAIPAAAACNNANMVMITPGSTHPDTTRGKSWIFRMSYRDEAQGQLMADYLADTYPKKKLAVLYDEANPSTQAVAKAFITRIQGHHHLPLVVIPYSNTQSSIDLKEASENLYQQLVTSWEQSIREIIIKQQIDLVYLPNISEDVVAQVELLKKAGFSGKIVGSDNWSLRVISKNPHFEGSLYTHHWNRESIANQQGISYFEKKYQQFTGEQAVDFTAYAFDAVHMLADVISEVGLDNDAIRMQLISGQAWEGITGRYRFDRQGESGHLPWLFQLQGGQAVPISWQPATDLKNRTKEKTHENR